MKRIMLVDDDAFYRTTFVGLVDWAAHGCEVPVTAEHGRHAISLLEERAVDAVITDMAMPFLNGAQLIGYIKKRWPQIRCYALSSFDDFDYVRSSLKNGADDYFLKHRLTTSAVIDLINQIESAGDGPAEAQPWATRAPDARWMALIADGFRGDPDEVERELPAFPALPVLIRVKDAPGLLKRYEVKERYVQFLSNAAGIAHSTLERYGAVVCAHDGFDALYALVFGENVPDPRQSAQLIAALKKNLALMFERYLNAEMLIAVSAKVGGAGQLSGAFQALAEELAGRAEGDVLLEPENEPGILSIRPGSERALSRMVEALDYDEVRRLIEDEFAARRVQSPTKQSIGHIAVEFLNILGRACRAQDIKFESLFGLGVSPYAQVLRTPSYSAIVAFVLDAYRAFYDRLNDRPDSENRIVLSAVRYIHNHFGEDISLTGVAENIHCNPAYLSRVFKAETGVGFLQYLTDFRLDRAKEMMRSGEPSIRHIAESVGFGSYNHFFKVFKQRLGVTPQAYMKQSGVRAQDDGES